MNPEKKPKRTRPRYVLIIEDNVHHAELLTEVLDHHFAPVIIHTVDTIEDGLEFVSQSNYDLILTAGVVRGTPIVNSIPILNARSGNTPIVVISGRGDEKLAAEIIKKGAVEYLGKTRETLENMPSLLEKYFIQKRAKKRKIAPKKDSPDDSPTPAAIVREVDRITQQALAIAGPRRKKRRMVPHNVEELDLLLSQIQHLRELASRLTSK